MDGLTVNTQRQDSLLLWALMFSIVAHLVIAIGVVFVNPDNDQPYQPPPIKVTLINNPTIPSNEDSTVLAQENSHGSADSENLPIFIAVPEQELIPNQNIDRVLTATDSNQTIDNQQRREQLRAQLQQNYIQLLQQSSWNEEYATAHTTKNKFVEYIETWRLSVEDIGNLNYPKAAKQRELAGRLVLDVTINRDGSLASVQVLESSGIKILDDAAKRIVHIAAPFNRFPDTFRNEVNRLHIVRTWIFSNGRVQSQDVING